MKALMTVILLGLLTSCSSSVSQARLDIAADNKAQAEISEDFGSAFEGDEAKRLEFLKGKITEKRQALDQLSQKELTEDQEVSQLTEVLENEILLLEAERFNLQSTDEDLDDAQSEGLEIDEE